MFAHNGANRPKNYIYKCSVGVFGQYLCNCLLLTIVERIDGKLLAVALYRFIFRRN